MISREKMGEAIARLRLMSHFHSSYDSDVLAALATELRDACEDDDAVDELVSALTHDYDGWPGVYQMCELARKQRCRRKTAAIVLAAKAVRAGHEKDCPGYWLTVDEESRVVSVRLCWQEFQGAEYAEDYSERMLRCRRKEGIDAEAMEAAEAARRGPGWKTRSEVHRHEPELGIRAAYDHLFAAERNARSSNS